MIRHLWLYSTFMTFCMLFVIATFYDQNFDKINIKMSFLYKVFNPLPFVEIPKRYYNNYKSIIFKLKIALYELKQSPRFYYKRRSSFLLEKLGLIHININHSIFILNLSLKSLVISTFVDEINIIGPKDITIIVKI